MQANHLLQLDLYMLMLIYNYVYLAQSGDMKFGVLPPASAGEEEEAEAAALILKTTPSVSSSTISSTQPSSRKNSFNNNSMSTSSNPTLNTASDFNQWLHAMKMVARLPGGTPPEFRRKVCHAIISFTPKWILSLS